MGLTNTVLSVVALAGVTGAANVSLNSDSITQCHERGLFNIICNLTN